MNRKKFDFKSIKNIAVIMLAIGLIVYPLRLSYTGAYFTDKASLGSNDHASSIKLKFEIHKFQSSSVEMSVDGSNIVASMNIPFGDGFDVAHTILETAKLTYNGFSISSPDLLVNMGNSTTQLNLAIDLNQINNFDPDGANLKIEFAGKGSGSGLSGLGERFLFEGDGELILPSLAKAIVAPVAIITPEAEARPKPIEPLVPKPDVVQEPEKETDIEENTEEDTEEDIEKEAEPAQDLETDTKLDVIPQLEQIAEAEEVSESESELTPDQSGDNE